MIDLPDIDLINRAALHLCKLRGLDPDWPTTTGPPYWTPMSTLRAAQREVEQELLRPKVLQAIEMAQKERGRA